MGRNNLPIEVKQNKGTSRKSRDANKGFDSPEMDTQKLISIMTEREQKWFDSMYEVLEPTRMLKQSDLYALEMLAKARATIEECDEVMEKEGKVITVQTRDGVVQKKSPYQQIRMDSYSIFKELSSKFSMNPADRGRVARPNSEDEDESDLSKLLRERND